MKKISLGIDIGGTNTVFGAVDAEGNILVESSIPTSDYPYFDDYPQYVEDLAAAMKSMLADVDFVYEIVGIGVGAPNASYHLGVIGQPPNLWRYKDEIRGGDGARIFPLATDLKAHFPECQCVLMTNDANAATIGEMMFGAAQGMNDFVMITLGTGLGSGFVAGGEMIYGHSGMAGELGHVNVVRGGRKCGCGLSGCLETYVSATGLKRTAFELMSEMSVPSPLREIPYSKLESLDVAMAAEAGDELALEAFRRTSEVLGKALADVIAITTPEAFILFGGLANAGDLLFKPTLKYMDENTMPALRGKTKILPSGVKNGNIAIMGAAALVWKSCQ